MHWLHERPNASTFVLAYALYKVRPQVLVRTCVCVC
jgi:hypothetical protein